MVGTIAIAISKAQPFEIPASKSPDFKWSDFRSPMYFTLGVYSTKLYTVKYYV